jgi:hypothetical protein
VTTQTLGPRTHEDIDIGRPIVAHRLADAWAQQTRPDLRASVGSDSQARSLGVGSDIAEYATGVDVCSHCSTEIESHIAPSVQSYGRAESAHDAGEHYDSTPHRLFVAVDLRAVRNIVGKQSTYKVLVW